MPVSNHKLTTQEMARFVADGYLRFDKLIPSEINQNIIREFSLLESNKILQIVGQPPEAGGLQLPASLTPLSECYPPQSFLGQLLNLPEVLGIVESLVGPNPLFDHDFVHRLQAGSEYKQHLHVDAVVDSADPSFDIQLFYFPQDVAPGAGGTRFVPATHLRRTRAEGVGRYQHLLGEQQFSGEAGTLMVFHHGLWHAGQPNPSDVDRWMYKIRLNPRVSQVRQWNMEDFDDIHNDSSDHTFARMRHDSVAQILRSLQPWQKGHEARYEQMQRALVWRYLSNDPGFDVDYYHTRIEQRVRLIEESS
ncbi:phytanoyl-CoA dioxygenase [Halieaceae bacterium IMCC14734]|uniref:Phytanoyl-CoA dioxygenase n=1 Tax=Candidatus Litorirhabdus singularis TaxID=2518993 RepID=A0ABT3TC70_9GAMM|nr:phytanoyl-CoA dioxygenase family protein [Candidatus Litorirhabdus singularis]MCX2979884.1 phytanoyl-CoA dioxygenase [Candidatus Litorirhabdus singularis]